MFFVPISVNSLTLVSFWPDIRFLTNAFRNKINHFSISPEFQCSITFCKVDFFPERETKIILYRTNAFKLIGNVSSLRLARYWIFHPQSILKLDNLLICSQKWEFKHKIENPDLNLAFNIIYKKSYLKEYRITLPVSTFQLAYSITWLISTFPFNF